MVLLAPQRTSVRYETRRSLALPSDARCVYLTKPHWCSSRKLSDVLILRLRVGPSHLVMPPYHEHPSPPRCRHHRRSRLKTFPVARLVAARLGGACDAVHRGMARLGAVCCGVAWSVATGTEVGQGVAFLSFAALGFVGELKESWATSHNILIPTKKCQTARSMQKHNFASILRSENSNRKIDSHKFFVRESFEMHAHVLRSQ